MTIYTVKTPAKLNLCLKVTGRRPDGYHDLISVMVPVTLFDFLEVRVLPERHVEIGCEGFPVPADRTNLVYRAAESFFARTGIERGVAVRLVKNIPVAAGMGGGSSDAAAMLLCLNEIWSRPLSGPDLHDTATRLGADVPFFLYCRPSLARGIGEILEPLEGWPRAWYVIVTPRLEISTAWVYGQLKLELTPGQYGSIINILKNRPLEVSRILENDLEKVTSGRYPIIEMIKRILVDSGADGAMMTGSGPTVFGLFSSRDRAEAAKGLLLSKDLGKVFSLGNWERPDRSDASIFEQSR